MFTGCRWRRLLLGVLAVALCGCAAGRHARTYPNDFSGADDLDPATLGPFGVDPGYGEEGGVTGVWEGTTTADCWGINISNPGRCAAVQNITLTMFQQGKVVTGFYKCAFGTEVCRNMDESGVIKNGSMNGKRLLMRVMLEDGSMCFFTGIPQGNRIDGRYSCLQGAAILEQGSFRTERSY